MSAVTCSPTDRLLPERRRERTRFLTPFLSADVERANVDPPRGGSWASDIGCGYMGDSGQKFIKRNRPPRVQIQYQDPYDAERMIELPFVMGVLADLSGNAS